MSNTFHDIISKISDFGIKNDLYMPLALAGEVGEYLNIEKKLARDGVYKTYLGLSGAFGVTGSIPSILQKIRQEYMAPEMADVFIYLVLCARRHGIDLEQAILWKLKIVEERRNKQSSDQQA